MAIITVKRTVTVPHQVGDKPIMGLIELGGKLFNKDYTYQLFFEHGFEGVKKYIKDEYLRRGGSEESFDSELAQLKLKVDIKLGVNGEPTGLAKKTRQNIKVRKK